MPTRLTSPGRPRSLSSRITKSLNGSPRRVELRPDSRHVRGQVVPLQEGKETVGLPVENRLVGRVDRVVKGVNVERARTYLQAVVQAEDGMRAEVNR